MKKLIIHIFIFSLLLISTNYSVMSQNYFRVSGEMTIKSKNPSGAQAITIGNVYFDRNIKQIIYHITFPEAETWITTDSLTFRVVHDSVVSSQASLGMAEFSVFNLALNSHLSDFGLKSSSFHVESVDLNGESVITTWAPQENMKDKMGNILVSSRDKKLFGVIFQDVEGKVLRTQYFEEYVEISGIAFPGKIVEIAYTPEGENYQISNFRNLKINELENNSIYTFNLPGSSGR